MIRIYRIEAEDGWGMYSRSGKDEKDIMSCPEFVSDITGVHPHPTKDPKLNWQNMVCPSDWYFGFSNIKDLLRWTQKKAVRAFLQEIGYKIHIYECRDKYARRGERQAIFMKHSSYGVKKVKILPVTAFG